MMSAIIELPAGANPLTLETLFKTLRSATSSYQIQVQTATAQLETWQKVKGFYPLLLDIFIDSTLPLEIRYLAIIQLKQGVDKFWRKTALNAVSKEDKVKVRSRIIESGVNEANRQLSLHNAIVFAKIVRYEYPNDWPDPISSLLETMKNAIEASASETMVVSRCLTMILHCVKELSTARLLKSRASLQAASPEIIHVVGKVYVHQVQIWTSFLQNGGDDEGGAIERIDISLRALKTLRRLFIFGYEHPNRDGDVAEFWSLSKTQFGDFLALANRQPPVFNPDIQDLIERHLIQYSKLHLDMSTTHPYSFALLPDSIVLVQAYWNLVSSFSKTFGVKDFSAGNEIASAEDFDEDKSLLEKLALKGLLIIRACIKLTFSPQQTFKYKKPEDKIERQKSEDLFKTELFTHDFALQAMETLVTKFFVLSPVDLHEWSQSWEEWELRIDSRGDEYLFSIRPCAEKLFLDLMIQFKSTLTDPLLKVFYNVAVPGNEDIMFKDSIYTAVALAAPVLRDKLDFDSFLTSVLVQDANQTSPGSNILRRSIGVMLGEWVSVKISKENRPLVYQIFDHFLNPEDLTNDDVVRISSAKQLKYAVDELDFEATLFSPFAPRIVHNIMGMIGNAEKVETQLLLISTITVIIEQMGKLVTPFVEKVVSALPALWTGSGEQHLMKQSILTLLERIVSALADQSSDYHNICMPLITMAIEPNSDIQLFLIDEALDLWLSIIAHTQPQQSGSADLLKLAAGLPPIFQLDESLLKALKVFEAYVLLFPNEMLFTPIKADFLRGLASLINRVKSEIGGQIIEILDYSIRLVESIGGETAIHSYAEDLIRSDVLPKLTESIYATWAHNSGASDAALTSRGVEGIAETEYFNIFSRLALAVEPKIFLEVFQAATREKHGEDVGWLFNEWFNHFGNIGHPTNRKLNAMGLTKMLGLGRLFLERHLEDLMSCWTDIVAELREDAEDRGGDSLVYADRFGYDPETAYSSEQVRKNELQWADPVHKVNITQFIRQQLDQACDEVGGKDEFVRIRPIDNTIARSFDALNIW